MAHVFTEIISCGKIGRIALKTYCKYHTQPVNVYGTKEDFKCIEENELIIFHEVKDRKILKAYEKDHHGLPMLWAKIINEHNDDVIVHFDSDVLFRSSIIEEVITLSKDYDLIGPRRNQKNHCDRLKIPHKTDTLATSLWCINAKKLSNWSYNELVEMCGTRLPRKLQDHGLGPTVDYFDPVVYDILRNGGKMFHFDFDDVGAVNEKYSRENIYADMNVEGVDVGSKIVHFAGVGSGMDAYLKKVELNKAYEEFAIKRYALFCKIFYDEDLNVDLSEFKNNIKNKDMFLKEME